MSKLISVIVPCYNVENLIGRCLESIQKQTIGIGNLEVILIDDASTDGTWEKIRQFEAQCPDSVIAIRCETNGKQGTARNIGMSYASAEYVTFVDSDDWLEEDMLEKLLAPMSEYPYDLVMTGYCRDDGNSQTNIIGNSGDGARHFSVDSDEKRGILIMCMSLGLCVWGKLYRKTFLTENELFFPEQMAYEDHFFILLLYLYISEALVLDECGYHYFVNPESTVLAKEAQHHYDVIKADDLTWAECERRGFLNKFRKELEVWFLLLAYLAPLKQISFRFGEPPYDFFTLLKESILAKIPDYKSNPYIKDYATDFNYGILQTLMLPVGKEDFSELCKLIKKRYS